MDPSKDSSDSSDKLSLGRRLVIAAILGLLLASVLTSGSSLVSQFFGSELSKSVADLVPEVLFSNSAPSAARQEERR